MIRITGLVLSSQDPERLSAFYRETLVIPFALAQHGKTRPHIECEVDNFHFAIIHKGKQAESGNLTPSFVVPDLKGFLSRAAERGITPLHPIIDIGEGKSISTICDPDGNSIRLIQIRPVV
jgi:predicted enzyme related to lactoylglutathione lyase